MMSMQPLINRLKNKPAGFDGIWFRAVGDAPNMAAIAVTALPLPGCWIIRSAEKSQHAGLYAENLTMTFDVIIGISNARSHSPGETDDMMLTYRQAVKSLLLGWEMGDVENMNFNGGRMLEVTDADYYWADSYSLKAHITNYLPDPPLPGKDESVVQIEREIKDGEL